MWAQMIHAPVSPNEAMKNVHNILCYASGNDSWPQDSVYKMACTFKVWQVLQDSEPSIFQLLNDMGKEGEMF